MKILAIDPGPKESAVVLWDSAAEQILAARKIPNADLEVALKNNKMMNSEDLTPDVCVIEMVASYGMAVGAEVFETVYWIGRFAQAWDSAYVVSDGEKIIPAERLFRKDIKMHLCHSMKAKDSNIRQALIDRLGKPGTKKNPGKTFGLSGDMWSALAVAIVFGDQPVEILKGEK